jgi:hypothetical protein
LNLKDTFASILHKENKHFIALSRPKFHELNVVVEQTIMSCIEDQNGVEGLFRILNSLLLQCYQKEWKESDTSNKILFYLKKLVNQDIIEETYRSFLLKRYLFTEQF